MRIAKGRTVSVRPFAISYLFCSGFSLVLMLHRTNIPLELAPWPHDLMLTAETAELKVHSCAQNKPALFTAGMHLFHCQNVAYSYIHGKTSVKMLCV